MGNKRASRYLAFDALKGLKEAIVSADEFTTKKRFPNLSDDDKDEMDVLLYKSYVRKEAINISYFNKGKIKNICDVVCKIDVIHHKITLLVNGTIYMASINHISLKDDI